MIPLGPIGEAEDLDVDGQGMYLLYRIEVMTHINRKSCCDNTKDFQGVENEWESQIVKLCWRLMAYILLNISGDEKRDLKE